MSEDKSQEPNLNLEPGVLENAVKEVANLYLNEISFRKETSPGIWDEYPQVTRLAYEELVKRDDAWRKVAEKFPALSAQILGALRFALKRARAIEDRYTTTQVEIIAHPLTHDVKFTEPGAKQFLEDIFIRRIMEGASPSLSYVNHTTPAILGSKDEGSKMREELGLKEGTCSMTLEKAIRATITGRLSLTRQTPIPLKMS